jgi:hypothetical protein
VTFATSRLPGATSISDIGASRCAPSSNGSPATLTEGVLFARSGSRYNRDFEDLVGWLATTMDKTALRRLVRVDCDTVGRIIKRVMVTGPDPGHLDKLFSIGVD